MAEQHERRGSSPVVRRATRDDLRHIGRLGALLVAAHHEFDPRRFLAVTSRTQDAYASFLGTQLDAPDAAVFVAEQNAEVVGYAYVAVESYDYMALRGPAGSKVRLSIARRGLHDPLEVSLMREVIAVEGVTHRREGDIGYIKIPAFNERTD